MSEREFLADDALEGLRRLAEWSSVFIESPDALARDEKQAQYFRKITSVFQEHLDEIHKDQEHTRMHVLLRYLVAILDVHKCGEANRTTLRTLEIKELWRNVTELFDHEINDANLEALLIADAGDRKGPVDAALKLAGHLLPVSGQFLERMRRDFKKAFEVHQEKAWENSRSRRHLLKVFMTALKIEEPVQQKIAQLLSQEGIE